jgi:Patatin-like phospholipase
VNSTQTNNEPTDTKHEADNQSEPARRIGVAISGGGHRAALWGTGTMLALADMDAICDVTTIASVSGGSIANAVLASGPDVSTASFDDIGVTSQAALQQWTHDGLFFPGHPTDTWVAVTLSQIVISIGTWTWCLSAGLRALARPSPYAAAAFFLTASVILAWTVMSATVDDEEGVRFAQTTRVALAATTIATVLVNLGIMLRPLPWPWASVAAFLVIAVLVTRSTVVRFGARSQKLEDALATTLLHGDQQQHASIPFESTVHHVWCTTDLQTGNHFYFTNRMLWAFRSKTEKIAAVPANISLARVAQTSACLPGAFLARTFCADDLPSIALDGSSLLTTVVLSDGGVYDNMADQWEIGLRNRLRQAPNAAKPLLGLPATHLVVANASQSWNEVRTTVTRPGFRGELHNLLLAKDVQYESTTAPRRRELVSTFIRAQNAAFHGRQSNDMNGMLVHIGSSPLAVVGIQSGDPAVIERAAQVEAVLLELSLDWGSIVKQNGATKTTLGPLGQDRATDLLHHSYVLCRTTGYIIHGWGRQPTPEEFGVDRFRELTKSRTPNVKTGLRSSKTGPFHAAKVAVGFRNENEPCL